MKELLSVRECVELFGVAATHHNKLRSCLELANKRHEEAMKKMAKEAWLGGMYATHYERFGDYGRRSFEEWYNEEYGSGK